MATSTLLGPRGLNLSQRIFNHVVLNAVPKNASRSIIHQQRHISVSKVFRSTKFSSAKLKFLTAAGGATVVASALALGMKEISEKNPLKVTADSGKDISPRHKIARSIKSDTDESGLKLTLYQYQTCPFCCKLRAYLDYRGFSYDVVEVNSVRRKEIKWSSYKKVPILVVENAQGDFLQLNDSSVISSILESFLIDKSHSIETVKSYYPALESVNQKGKTEYDWPNRYFLMYGENKPDGTPELRNEERKWRHWTDATLVHTISPNIYRTPKESLEAFRWFSDNGDWEKHFSTPERWFIVYVGAAVMYLVGKTLIKKYNLKEDVRESLYDACNVWVKAVGKNRRFMGGDSPNLADISVYGVLTSMEGCSAFKDALDKTKIGDWYYRMKTAVNNHEGAKNMAQIRTS